MRLRNGTSGPAVASLQRFLISTGHLGAGGADGVWGPISSAALVTWQDAYRLVGDGVVGPATLGALEASGWTPGDDSAPTEAISPLVKATAARLGIKASTLEGFRRVESGGDPKAIRFEPHLFLRKIPGAAIPYTPSSRGAWSLTGSETNHAAFQNAYAIDKIAAVESSSWGLFQVLGSWLLDAFPGTTGDRDPETAVLRFWNSPEAVSFDLVEAWFRGNPRALRAAQADPVEVRELVRRYNGGGQVDRYSSRLEAEIARAENLSCLV